MRKISANDEGDGVVGVVGAHLPASSFSSRKSKNLKFNNELGLRTSDRVSERKERDPTNF